MIDSAWGINSRFWAKKWEGIARKETVCQELSQESNDRFSKSGLYSESQKYLAQDVMTTDRIWRVPAKDIQLLISQSIVECSYLKACRIMCWWSRALATSRWKSWLCHLLFMWPWVRYVTFLSLSSFIFKVVVSELNKVMAIKCIAQYVSQNKFQYVICIITGSQRCIWDPSRSEISIIRAQ